MKIAKNTDKKYAAEMIGGLAAFIVICSIFSGMLMIISDFTFLEGAVGLAVARIFVMVTFKGMFIKSDY